MNRRNIEDALALVALAGALCAGGWIFRQLIELVTR